MPARSTRQRWVDQISTTYRDQQHLKLEKELESDDSSVSDGSEQLSSDGLEDLNDPATLQAALASLSEELDLLSLDLDMDMLDPDIPDVLDDGADNPSPHSSPTSSDMDDEIEAHFRDRLSTLLKYMEENRVLEPQPPNPKSSQLHLLDHWANHNLRNFRAKLRVHPTTFQRLVDLLKDHPIFHNNSNSLQLPVHQTLHIPVRHGVCVRSRNQLAGTLQQIRRHITTTPRSGSEKSSPAGSEKRRLRSATFWSNQSSKRFVRGASQSTPDYYTLRVRILLLYLLHH